MDSVLALCLWTKKANEQHSVCCYASGRNNNQLQIAIS